LQDTKKEADRIAAAYKDLGAQLEANSALASKVDELAKKVTKIERAVSFKASASLTPALRENLERTFGTYYAYLKSVGFTLAGKPPAVSLDLPGNELNEYFEPDANQIVMSEVMAKLPYPGPREYTHYVLFALKKGASIYDPTGLESGLADYFPSSFADQPDFMKEIWDLYRKQDPGISINRNLDNHRAFGEIQPDKTEVQ